MRCPFLFRCERTFCRDTGLAETIDNRQALPSGIRKCGERDWHCPHCDSLLRASELHAQVVAFHEKILTASFRVSHVNRIGGYPTVYRDLQ
jgi:hypothetical protein